LILNGKAAGHDALRAAIARQRIVGHSIEVRVTWEKGDARRFVAEAGRVDLLISAGGDGTLNEVVHGLMGSLDGRAACFGSGATRDRK
jgi:diacylglycerol kinase family enzyme